MSVFDGDIHQALDDVGDVLVVARHATSQHSMLSSLIGAALLSFADRLVQHAIDRALIGPGEAIVLLRSLDELAGDDPLAFKMSITVGQIGYVDAVIARYSRDDGLQLVRDDYLPYFRQQNEQASVATLEALAPQDLDRIIGELRAIQKRIVDAMRLKDEAATRAALDDIDQHLRDAPDGRILEMCVGSTSHTFEQMHRLRKTLDDRIAMLRGIANGSVDPLSLANAACWYIRASVKVEQVDPAALALIDAAAANFGDPNAAIDANLTETLARDDVREVLEMLATASKIERCDFTYAEGNWTQYYRPYHAGVLACGRLLMVEAMRLAKESRRDDTVALLSQLLRLSSEVARDGCIAGSLAAHRLFEQTAAVIAMLATRDFNPAQSAALRTAMDRFSRGDPFHYQPAIASMHSIARAWLMWLLRRAPSTQEQIAAGPRPTTQQEMDDADAILNQCDAGRVLSLLAACEEQYIHNRLVPSPIRPPVDGLWPIYDIDAVQRSRQMLPAIIQWAKMRAIAALPQADLPRIAPIEDRARQSIDDFRACAERIGLAAPSESTTTQPGP